MIADPPTVNSVHPEKSMLRVGLGLLLGTVAYIAPFSAGTAVLLPARIAVLHPDDKVQLLAILTGIAAVVALVSAVFFGALSDRTHTRFGPRVPWIVGGAAASALLLIPVAFVDTFGAMLLFWCLATAGINATGAAIITILPERVPTAKRATISAIGGVALLLGTALGTVLGSLFVTDMTAGFVVIGIVGFVLALASVIVLPGQTPNRAPADTSSIQRPGTRAQLTGIAASFRLPRHAPDFYWALWGRLALVLGYFMVNGFQLYIFTDYIHLSETDAAHAVGLNSIIFLLTALIGAIVAGPLSDRLKRRKIFVIIASFLAIAAVTVPIFMPSHLGMIGFAIIGGIAFGSYYAVDAALTTEVLPSPDSRGRDLGFLNIANTGGQALAPAASAALVGLGIGFLPVFIGAIAACAIAVICIPPIRSVR